MFSRQARCLALAVVVSFTLAGSPLFAASRQGEGPKPGGGFFPKVAKILKTFVVSVLDDLSIPHP